MDEKLDTAGKEVLVEMVKLAQKRGMESSKGKWKEFLNSYDNGASMSDPSRRSPDVLLAFLNTVTNKDDVKYLMKVMEFHADRDDMLKLLKETADTETPEQRLVRVTLEHPQYPSSYAFPSHEEGWEVTKQSKRSKAVRSTDMISVDCEMVLCEDGTDALARVCVVDHNLQVKLDKLVKPDKAVADYRTDITGISAQDLDGETCSLINVQKSLKNRLKHGTILVGHSLNNDLQALKLDHARVIDTSLVFNYANGSNFRRASLGDLCKFVLGFELRKEGAPHSCLDDASAAMKLVLAKIEGCVDNFIPMPKKAGAEGEMAKLLVHRIPHNLPTEDLHNIIPGDFAIEMKAHKKTGGGKYSAFVIFGNQHLANEAYEELDGDQGQDSYGRLQKLVSYKFGTGVAGTLCVCKMARYNQLGITESEKRSNEGEVPVDSKKLKSDLIVQETELNKPGSELCYDHLKEIKKLKLQLSLRDQEISNLNKTVSALKRKQKG